MIFSEDLILLFLIVARVTGIFIVIPIFNSNNIPMLAKTWFIIFISLLIVPTTIAGTLDLSTMPMVGYYFIIELFNGIVMGSAVGLTLTVVYVAGKLVDTAIGFSMVSVISALDNNQMPVSANIYYII
ncbi:MAG: flagellar biosynthetic protein FliR, partial [Acidaminobacteraceae bacterium]